MVFSLLILFAVLISILIFRAYSHFLASQKHFFISPPYTFIEFLKNMHFSCYFNSRKCQFHTKEEEKKIALFGPLSSPLFAQLSHDFVANFKKTFRRKHHLIFYDTFGREELISLHLKDLVAAKYDLIVSLGAYSTQTIINLLEEKALNTPLLFSGIIQEREQENYFLEKQKKGVPVCGVFESARDYERQISLLLILMPVLKKILIIYHPLSNEGATEKEHTFIKKVCESKGVALKSIQVNSPEHVIPLVERNIHEGEIVMILRDETVLIALDNLVHLCEMYKKPLFCSESLSVKRGAGLGYGAAERIVGVKEAHMAFQILSGKIALHTLPLVHSLAREKIMVNQKALLRQGIALDSHIFMFLKYMEPHE